MQASGLVQDAWSGSKAQNRQADLFKRDVANKLSTYFRDRVDIAMNRAGGFEQAAFSRRGTIEDSIEGQAWRFFSQFKNFSFTMISKFSNAYYHEVLAGASRSQQAADVGGLLVTMTALGYLSMSLKDLAQGKTPRMPDTQEGIAKVAMESMARGGAGGLYGDYLLGEFDSRHGRSALSALAGPVFGKLDDAADLVNQMKQAGASGDPAKMRASAFLRFGTNIFPGNMPFVKQGLDYLFLHSLVETLNPGYTERMRQRMSQQGQDYLFPQN
jgi:hypothetical protein